MVPGAAIGEVESDFPFCKIILTVVLLGIEIFVLPFHVAFR